MNYETAFILVGVIILLCIFAYDLARMLTEMSTRSVIDFVFDVFMLIAMVALFIVHSVTQAPNGAL